MASWRDRQSELALLVGGALTGIYFAVPDGAAKNSIYGLLGFLAGFVALPPVMKH